MRHSTFWELLTDEFGSGYAASLARDHVFGALGGRTAQEALAGGIPPRQVWEAIIADFDIPPERHFGREVER